MDKNKALSMLGLARRAGKLSMGHDTALSAVMEKKAELLIFACDTSDRLRREFQTAMDKRGIDIPVIAADITISEIHYSCGYKAGVIAVNDKNFSTKISSLLEDEA
ncbi:MAG: ribosomal L7Ae/L30e/S12e/Gadd45 family protein [Eubacterium sp.]